MLFIDDLTSGGSNFSKVYTYDPLDRLETYTEGEFGSITGSAAATETWGLDTYGNWDVETINGVAQYNTINSQNELTAFNSSSANQSFDPNGNTLSGSTGAVYIYNAWNQMTSETLSSVTQSFTYDALGQRITLTSGSTTQYQYYSSGGQVIETDTVADGTGSAISQYVWGLMYVNDLLVRDDNAVSGDLGGGTSDLGRRLFAIEDANFDVMGLVSGSSSGAVVVQRYEYTPYGTQTVYNISYGSLSSDTYHFGVGFQGGLMDRLTGLVHFDARDYDPVTGRWMTTDPLGYVNGPNEFQLEQSNPVSGLDSSGLSDDPNWKLGGLDDPEMMELVHDLATAKRYMDEAYNRSAYYWNRVSWDHGGFFEATPLARCRTTYDSNQKWWHVYLQWQTRVKELSTENELLKKILTDGGYKYGMPPGSYVSAPGSAPAGQTHSYDIQRPWSTAAWEVASAAIIGKGGPLSSTPGSVDSSNGILEVKRGRPGTSKQPINPSDAKNGTTDIVCNVGETGVEMSAYALQEAFSGFRKAHVVVWEVNDLKGFYISNLPIGTPSAVAKGVLGNWLGMDINDR